MYPNNINDWPKVTVYDTDFRKCLLNMANAITKLELWDWLVNFKPDKDKGFMFSSNENLNLIEGEVSGDGHSGATFAYCMRCMESIANNGFEEFKNKIE